MKDISQFILEELEQINESISSDIVNGWLELLKRSWNKDIFFKSWQWDKITDADLQWYDQMEAKKLAYKRNSDIALFWVDNNDDIIAETHGNYAWYIINNSHANGDLWKIKSIMPIVRLSKGAYAIDNSLSTKELRKQRAEEKAGAIALMKETDIKNSNISRYEKIIKDMHIKDGSMIADIQARFNDVTERYKSCFENLGNVTDEGFKSKLKHIREVSQYYNMLMDSFDRTLSDYEYEKSRVGQSYNMYNFLKKDLKNLDEAIKRYNALFEA